MEEHLDLAALVARLEGLQLARRLQLARQRPDQRRRRAPRAHELARLEVEGRPVERADDRVVLDGALVEGRADVGADVGSGEDAAALGQRRGGALRRNERAVDVCVISDQAPILTSVAQFWC